MSRAKRPSRSESASEWSGTSASPRGNGGSDALDGLDSIRFGCSMLSRITSRSRHPGTLCAMRCSLGYALHDDDDVTRCRAVDGPGECWKNVPSWRVNALPGAGARANGRERPETVTVAVEVVELLGVERNGDAEAPYDEAQAVVLVSDIEASSQVLGVDTDIIDPGDDEL